jgi:hypothetical protein
MRVLDANKNNSHGNNLEKKNNWIFFSIGFKHRIFQQLR